MMETAQEKKDWGLVHTPNGEWIYEYNAVFVPYKYVALLLIKAKRQGKKLAVYRQSKDSFWCYRHQLKALGFGNYKEQRHELKITKKPKHNEL